MERTDDEATLKQPLAEQVLDMATMTDLLSKNDARSEARSCRASEGTSRGGGRAAGV
jgi:hypothetical protein